MRVWTRIAFGRSLEGVLIRFASAGRTTVDELAQLIDDADGE